MSKKLIIVVDTFSFFFRAYHATSSLKSSDGTPTSILYALANFIMTLYRMRPDFIIFALEGGNSKRKEVYPSYKANRKEPPEDLLVQLPIAIEWIKKLGFANIAVEGYEADDVIASIARFAYDANTMDEASYECRIISTDKDLYQLIREGVYLYDPMKKREIHKEQCYEKFGVEPCDFISYQAIVGDSIDNIAGVKGVGAKGAAKLISIYHSLDAIYESKTLELDVGKSVASKMQEGKESAYLSYRLVRLYDDILCDFDISACAPPLANPLPNIADELERYSLYSILKRIEKLPATSRATSNREDVQPSQKPTNPLDEIVGGNALSSHALAESKIALARRVEHISLEGATALLEGSAEDIYLLPLSSANIKANFDTKGEQDFSALSYIALMQRGVANSPSHPNKDEVIYLVSLGEDALKGSLFSIDIAPLLASLARHCLYLYNAKPFLKVYLAYGGGGRIDFVDVMLLEYLYNPSASFALPYPEVLAKKTIKELTSSELATLLNSALSEMIGRSMALEGGNAFNENGFNEDGLNQDGFNENGFNEDGLNQDGFNENGFNESGLNQDGFNENALKENELNADAPKSLSALEHSICSILASMELYGIAGSIEYFSELNTRLLARIGQLSDEIASIVEQSGKDPININSPKQLSSYLFDTLGLDAKGLKKTKSFISTSNEVLEQLRGAHPVVDLLLSYRELAKIESTYTRPLLELLESAKGGKEPRVYTTFLQIGTNTGRLSSRYPNLQNIPARTSLGREIRAGFIPSDGYRLLSIDYSQIELRLLAHLSADPTLISAFRAGADVHTETAIRLFGALGDSELKDKRIVAKSINFGLIYGMGPHSLAKTLGISNKEAKDYIDSYFSLFPTVQSYLASQKAALKASGTATTLLGHHRYFDFANANKRDEASYIREGINAIFQGSAADLIKLAMSRIASYVDSHALGRDIRLLLQIHDELIFEVSKVGEGHIDALVSMMESVYRLRVPLRCAKSLGDNWAALK